MAKTFISGRDLINKYNISSKELTNLVFENQIFPARGAINLLYNDTQVKKYFDKLKRKEALPKIISAKDVIAKYKLSRTEFAQLVDEGKLKELPLHHEQNLYFEYLAVCEFFATYKNNL